MRRRLSTQQAAQRQLDGGTEVSPVNASSGSPPEKGGCPVTDGHDSLEDLSTKVRNYGVLIRHDDA